MRLLRSSFRLLEEVHLHKWFVGICEREEGELVQPGDMWGMRWGLLCGTSGRKDLWLVPCHSCHIYGIWTGRSKKVWQMLKNHQLAVAMKITKEGSFHREGRFWLPLFTILLLFYVFDVGKAKSATQSFRMILTLNGFPPNHPPFPYLFFSIIVFAL